MRGQERAVDVPRGVECDRSCSREGSDRDLFVGDPRFRRRGGKDQSGRIRVIAGRRSDDRRIARASCRIGSDDDGERGGVTGMKSAETACDTPRLGRVRAAGRGVTRAGGVAAAKLPAAPSGIVAPRPLLPPRGRAAAAVSGSLERGVSSRSSRTYKLTATINPRNPQMGRGKIVGVSGGGHGWVPLLNVGRSRVWGG